MSRSCEISACLQIDMVPVLCSQLDPVPVTCLNVCLPGEGLNLFSCDLVFTGYDQIDSCTLVITETAQTADAITVTANATGLLYSLYTLDGTIVHDWQSSNVFDMTAEPTDEYIVQVKDSFGCTDISLVEVPVDIDFVSAGSLVIGSGTSIDVDIPATVEVGDYMVLHVMHRSALTTPAGWAVIEGPTLPIVDFDQQQTVLSRVAEAGDAGSNVTIIQASSARFLGHVQAFRSVYPIVVIDSDGLGQAAAGLNLPELPSTAGKQMAVVTMSNVYGNTSGDTDINPPAGYTQTTPVLAVDNRMGCAYKKLVHPETISGRFEISTTDTDRTAISIILGT